MYLKKFKRFCDSNNLKLILLSPPILEQYFQDTKNWKEMRQQIRENQLEDVFEHYFESIEYLPQECFRDSIHLKHPYVIEYREILKNKILLIVAELDVIQ